MPFWYGTATRPNSLYVSGLDLIAENVVPLDIAPIRWQDMAGEAWGSLSFTVEDTAANRSIPGGADVRLRVDDTVVFGGTLLRRRFSRLPGAGRVIECECVSYDAWLDWRIVPRWSSRTDLGNRVRKITTDRGMVHDLVHRRGGPLMATASTVQSTNTSMDVVRIVRKTLREALEMVADEAQSQSSPGTRRFYVDEKLHVHWYTGLEGNAAPYRIADGSYVRTVMATSGLVEYWSLREESGTTNYGSQGVADLTLAGGYEQGLTAGVVNEPQYRATRFTTADTGTAAKSSAPASLFPGDTFSLECWFRRSATQGTTQSLIVSSGSTDNAYWVRFTSADKIEVLLRTGSAQNFITTGAYTDTSWHHLVVAHDPGDTTVYVDGASVAGTHTNRVFGSAANVFRVGATSSTFIGTVQHVAVYSSKLSAATALAHYDQGISIAPEDLVMDDDWGDAFHHAYVVGANAHGSGWVYNTGSDFERGAIQSFVEREHADTVAERNRAGRAAIRRHARERGITFTTDVAAAWRSGQTLYVTDSALGLSGDTFEVRNVDAEMGPGGVVRWSIEAGVLRRRLLHRLRRVA